MHFVSSWAESDINFPNPSMLRMPMKFRKILAVGIDESKLDFAYWCRLDRLAERRVALPKGNPEIKRS